MLSQTNLVQLAEELAGRIPDDESYKEERNVSWGLVCTGWLQLNDLPSALRALAKISEPQAAAPMRLAILKWVCALPDSGDLGRDVVRETVERISEWEPWLARMDITDLVLPIIRLMGEDGARVLARNLRDPFTSGNVLVTLAGQFSWPHERRPLLEEAERIAAGIRDGNRDFALLWVVQGYEAAGFADDAKRVNSMMQEQNLSENMSVLLSNAQVLLRSANKILEPSAPAAGKDPQVDSPLDRLSRFLEYRRNDLKVRFLVDAAAGGSAIGVSECEAILTSPDFQRVEPPRQPSIHRDPTLLDDDAFARFWFDRPIPLKRIDERVLEGDLDDDVQDLADPVGFLKKATALFHRFGSVGRSFSQEQIEQGLWFLFGYPFSAGEHLWRNAVPLDIRLEFVRSMIHPFRDYYNSVSDEFQGHLFFMWWDMLLHHGPASDSTEEAAIENEVIEVLVQILALPSEGCASSALHGLNHLHPNPRAISVVTQYLDANREKMTSERIKWVSACRDGLAR
ncbi:MAG TPA: hypothetical protein VMH05_02540 [Bryobacteraceae bacterium]|nr:hypothetical protein [Bryobacteraceae bacterium]